jgi:hypothetical protein
MDKSIKAALLSAFVFPGAGHLYLKKYVSAVVLAGAAFVPLYWLVSKTVEMTLAISDKILSGAVPLDVAAITALVSKQVMATEGYLYDVCMAVIVIVWLVAIFDAYRLGRLQSG